MAGSLRKQAQLAAIFIKYYKYLGADKRSLVLFFNYSKIQLNTSINVEIRRAKKKCRLGRDQIGQT